MERRGQIIVINTDADGLDWDDLPDVPSPSDDDPANVGDRSSGSSDDYSRGDHNHGITGSVTISDDAATSIGSSSAAGMSGEVSASDHVHDATVSGSLSDTDLTITVGGNDSSTIDLSPLSGSTGATSFTGLSDTPSDFGDAGQIPVVNTDEDGLEWVDELTLQSSGGTSSIISNNNDATERGDSDDAARANHTHVGASTSHLHQFGSVSSIAEVGISNDDGSGTLYTRISHTHRGHLGGIANQSSTTNDAAIGYGSDGQFLTTDGTTASWSSLPAGTFDADDLGLSISGQDLSIQYDGTIEGTVTLPASGADLVPTHNADNVVIDGGTNTDATINSATTSVAGVMSASDKTKLDDHDHSDSDEGGTVSYDDLGDNDVFVSISATNEITVSVGSENDSGTINTLDHSHTDTDGDGGEIIVPDGIYLSLSNSTLTVTLQDGSDNIDSADLDYLPNAPDNDADGDIDYVLRVPQNSGDAEWGATTASEGVTNLDIPDATHDTDSLDITSSTGTSATIESATTSLAGLMSSVDKIKLDEIPDVPDHTTDESRYELHLPTSSDGGDATWVAAEENVQSDWTETVTTEDSYILNKPELLPVAPANDADDTKKYVLEVPEDMGDATWVDASDLPDSPTDDGDYVLNIDGANTTWTAESSGDGGITYTDSTRAPTITDTGELGDLWFNGTDSELYILSSIDGANEASLEYTWTSVDGNLTFEYESSTLSLVLRDRNDTIIGSYILFADSGLTGDNIPTSSIGMDDKDVGSSTLSARADHTHVLETDNTEIASTSVVDGTKFPIVSSSTTTYDGAYVTFDTLQDLLGAEDGGGTGDIYFWVSNFDTQASLFLTLVAAIRILNSSFFAPDDGFIVAIGNNSSYADAEKTYISDTSAAITSILNFTSYFNNDDGSLLEEHTDRIRINVGTGVGSPIQTAVSSTSLTDDDRVLLQPRTASNEDSATYVGQYVTVSDLIPDIVTTDDMDSDVVESTLPHTLRFTGGVTVTPDDNDSGDLTIDVTGSGDVNFDTNSPPAISSSSSLREEDDDTVAYGSHTHEGVQSTISSSDPSTTDSGRVGDTWFNHTDEGTSFILETITQDADSNNVYNWTEFTVEIGNLDDGSGSDLGYGSSGNVLRSTGSAVEWASVSGANITVDDRNPISTGDSGTTDEGDAGDFWWNEDDASLFILNEDGSDYTWNQASLPAFPEGESNARAYTLVPVLNIASNPTGEIHLGFITNR